VKIGQKCHFSSENVPNERFFRKKIPVTRQFEKFNAQPPKKKQMAQMHAIWQLWSLLYDPKMLKLTSTIK
jgi:hypothetical protein